MKTERKKRVLPLSLETRGPWHMQDLSFAGCLFSKADTVPTAAKAGALGMKTVISCL